MCENLPLNVAPVFGGCSQREWTVDDAVLIAFGDAMPAGG
jgi:hypothetical protein